MPRQGSTALKAQTELSKKMQTFCSLSVAGSLAKFGWKSVRHFFGHLDAELHGKTFFLHYCTVFFIQILGKATT